MDRYRILRKINRKYFYKDGFAWAYRKYSKKYISAESYARKKRLGLWNDTNPIAPYNFRKQKRDKNK
ncbi:thermonuclease family protein [Campylobacter geochelonis]|uniref:thermonuclease family protein n=1 Tax=Campylobacter geochelonis TaxID=1780362 RepID=UPI00105554D6